MKELKNRNNIPTRQECLELMLHYKMRYNIMRHSIRVRDVALFIAKRLFKAGHELDINLVEASALLHDITKTRGLSTGEKHSETGRQLLEELGYNRVAQVVGNHVKLNKAGNPEIITEDEVVNYSDKRVMHDKIVSLNKRYADLKKRYGTNKESMAFLEQMEAETRELEKKIFSALNIDPSAVLEIPEQKSPFIDQPPDPYCSCC